MIKKSLNTGMKMLRIGLSSRQSFDIYRNYMNTPEFFRILPDISQLKGIDIGCGEVYNTRIASKKGAQMVGIDSTIFIEKALEKFPHLFDCNNVANFLIIRCRKQ